MNTKAEMQKLVLENMGLACRIAWEYHGRGMEQEELQSAALYGLVKAASGFDRSRGVPFPAYASAVMRNAVRMEFRKAGKDQKAIWMAVCRGMTQKEAGEQIGLSQPHVSRHIRSGIKKIRKTYMKTMYPAGISQSTATEK